MPNLAGTTWIRLIWLGVPYYVSSDREYLDMSSLVGSTWLCLISSHLRRSRPADVSRNILSFTTERTHVHSR